MLRDRTTVKPGIFLLPHVVAQLSGSLVVQVVEGSEITATEYALTSWLAIQGRATPTDLASDLGMALTTVSTLIDRLVQKKQLRRVRHPDDGRSYLVELTRRGVATNTRNARRLGRCIARLHEHLEGDPEEILAAMRRLEEALRRTLAEA